MVIVGAYMYMCVCMLLLAEGVGSRVVVKGDKETPGKETIKAG